MFKQKRLELENTVLNSLYNELFIENGLPTVELEDNLSDLQKKAYTLFQKKENLLVLGPAGTGKSTCLKKFNDYAYSNNKKLVLTATTGIAAYNIGGITIHSFIGFGNGVGTTDALVKKVRRKKEAVSNIKNTDILVIDEISMLSAELFEKINCICQSIRKNTAPFGGIQIVCSGDLLQLLPVFNDAFSEKQDTRLIVESAIFCSIFKNTTVVLEKNFRQSGNDLFVKILNRIRIGEYNESDIEQLETRRVRSNEGSLVLVSSNKKASIINTTNLNNISSDDTVFTTTVTHTGRDTETIKILEKELVNQMTLRGFYDLRLKVGARVILVKNIDVSAGLVNGAIGTVSEFTSGGITVLFDNGQRHIISKVEITLELNDCSCTATQYPLILAWAITIHKSQSLTLESAVLDLQDCFCDHQVYVALSRVKYIEGLFLKSFSKSKITVNQTMKNFIENLECT